MGKGGRRSNADRASALFALLLLVAYAGLVIVTRRAAERWVGADYGLYIMHARNLVEGLPYAQTGYVPNPANAIISPAAYPFGYPLLLAVPFSLWGLDLGQLELVGCAALIAIVAATYALARHWLDTGWALLVAGATGFVPQLVSLRDTISSDLVFTAWALLALWLHDRARNPSALAALTVAVGMAEATRSAGIALAAALVLADIACRAPGWKSRIGSVALGMGFAVLGNKLLHADASSTYLSYLDRIGEAPVAYLAHAARDYLKGLSYALGLSFGKSGNLACVLVFVAAALLGWAVAARERIGAALLFVPIYLGLLVLFPVRLETARYLVPLLPLLMIFAVRGIAALRFGATTAMVGTLAFFVACFGASYRVDNPFEVMTTRQVDAAVGRELAAIGTMIPDGEIILARNPRVVAVFSGDEAGIWNEHPAARDIRDPERRLGARFLLLDRRPSDTDEVRVLGYISAEPGLVRQVAQTANFTLYAFR